MGVYQLSLDCWGLTVRVSVPFQEEGEGLARSILRTGEGGKSNRYPCSVIDDVH